MEGTVKNSVGVDWLTCTFPLEAKNDVVAFVAMMFNTTPFDREHGGMTYRSCLGFCDGVSLFYTDGESADGDLRKPIRNEICLDIKGSAVGAMDAESVVELVKGCYHQGAKCTRVDVRWDDYEKVISVLDLWEQYAGPGKFSGFKVRQLIAGGSVEAEGDGSGVYFGRRGKLGSGVQLVVYDKRAESAGVIDAIRWEARYAKEKANAAFEKLAVASDVAEFERLLGSLVSGCIEFYEDHGEKNLDRRETPGWWERIRGLL